MIDSHNNVYFQRSNGASLICLHEQNERNGDKYHYYVLYGLLAWTNDSTNIDHTVSPHLFTNIYNYRYWLEKRLKLHIWDSLHLWYSFAYRMSFHHNGSCPVQFQHMDIAKHYCEQNVEYLEFFHIQNLC